MSIFTMLVRRSLGVGGSILRMSILAALMAAPDICAEAQENDRNVLLRMGESGGLLTKAAAEQAVLAAIKSNDISVVHLWAPWCSNCQAELKNGGWLKMV